MDGRGENEIQEIERLIVSQIEKDRDRGFKMLDSRYRKIVCGCVRSIYPGLSSAQLAEAWEAAMVSLFKFASTGRFRETGGLIGLMITLCKRRAHDLFFKKKGKKSEPLEFPAEMAVIQLRVGSDHNMVELLGLFLKITEHFPPMERSAIRAYFRLIPRSDFEVCRRELFEEVVQELPRATQTGVNSALQRARVKVRKILKSRGYGHG